MCVVTAHQLDMDGPQRPQLNTCSLARVSSKIDNSKAENLALIDAIHTILCCPISMYYRRSEIEINFAAHDTCRLL